VRPIRGNCRNWAVKGGDGCFHTVPVEKKHRGRKQGEKQSKPYEIKYADCECCEHCPFPDCIKRGGTPCLTEITYSEYCAFLNEVDRLFKEMSASRVYRVTGLSINRMKNIVQRTRYPYREEQKIIKKYLEEHTK
jgi:hypothetical protein